MSAASHKREVEHFRSSAYYVAIMGGKEAPTSSKSGGSIFRFGTDTILEDVGRGCGRKGSRGRGRGRRGKTAEPKGLDDISDIEEGSNESAEAESKSSSSSTSSSTSSSSAKSDSGKSAVDKPKQPETIITVSKKTFDIGGNFYWRGARFP